MSDTPKWREDFPIRWEADNYITRREFTKFLVLVSGATFAGNGYFVLQGRREEAAERVRVEIARVEEVPVGGVRLFRYPTPNDPAILIRLAENEWVAYLQRCTHLSCPVHYSAKSGRIECPCHNGAFEAQTGKVLEGPPPRPLPKIVLRIEEGKIYAEGVHGA
jgi:Rieske Fe-S protein